MIEKAIGRVEDGWVGDREGDWKGGRWVGRR